MNKLILILTLFISTVCFSQITIEVIEKGERVITQNDSADVTIVTSTDSLSITSNGLTSYYLVDYVETTTYDGLDGREMRTVKFYLLKRNHDGLVSITLCSNESLAVFIYKSKVVVTNSGPGLHYSI